MRRGGGFRGSMHRGSFGGSRHYNRRIMSSHRHHGIRTHRSPYRGYGYYGGYGYSPFRGFMGLFMVLLFITFAIFGSKAIFVIIILLIVFAIYRSRKKPRSYSPAVPARLTYPPISSKPQSQPPLTNQYNQRPKAKFCQACGVGILPNSLFCSECGTKV